MRYRENISKITNVRCLTAIRSWNYMEREKGTLYATAVIGRSFLLSTKEEKENTAVSKKKWQIILKTEQEKEEPITQLLLMHCKAETEVDTEKLGTVLLPIQAKTVPIASERNGKSAPYFCQTPWRPSISVLIGSCRTSAQEFQAFDYFSHYGRIILYDLIIEWPHPYGVFHTYSGTYYWWAIHSSKHYPKYQHGLTWTP